MGAQDGSDHGAGATGAPRSVHLPIAILLIAAAIYLPVGIDWGLPNRASWDDDEVVATRVEAWPRRYPPLQRDLLDALATASRAAMPERFGGPSAGRLELREQARWVSVLFTLGTLYLLFRISRRLHGDGGAWLPPLVYLTALEVPFHAKIARLEAPYLFWFAGALLYWQRARDRRRRPDVLGFAACGALSLLSKDQAVALFALPAVWLLFELRPRSDDPPDRGGWRSWSATGLLAALVVAVMIAVAYRLPGDWRGLVDHVEQLTGRGSQPYRMVAPTVGGHWELLRRAGSFLRFLLTDAGIVLALASVGISLGSRFRRRLLPLLLFPLSYYLFFIAPIGYHRVRFFLPVALVLALLAPVVGRWLEGVARPYLVHLACALLVVSVALPSHVELHERMVDDTRYDVERLLLVPAVEEGSVLVLGNVHESPRIDRIFDAYGGFDRTGCEHLRPYEWIVLNRFHASWDRRTRRSYEAIRSGRFGFDRFAEVTRPRDDALRLDGILTNLVRPSPPLEILRRRSPICASDGADWYRQAVASGRPEEWRRFVLSTSGDAWPTAPGRDESRGIHAVFGVAADGWTEGTAPAIVVTRGGAEPARLRVAHWAPPEHFPVEVLARSAAGEEATFLLEGPGVRELELPAARGASGPRVWELAASRGWPAPGADERLLGFQVALGMAESTDRSR